jgi:phosphoglycerate dehydrogenase-like enzyme
MSTDRYIDRSVEQVGPTGTPVVTVPDERWKDLWPDSATAPVEVRDWAVDQPPDPATGQRIGLVVLPYLVPARLELLAGLPRLRAVQTLTAGYENVLPHLPAGVALCNARGVHDASTAELAVGLTLAAVRGLGDYARAQPDGRWLAGTRPSLADRRVLLLGAGSVGAAIARRLEPFEVELTRVARHARDDDHGHVHAVAELSALLPRHEVVIVVVPLTETTRGLVDAAFLAAMPDGAVLVNVARGPVVDTDALVAELSAGRLQAALDVTDPEPLPPGHPLWTTPHTLISPHVGGNSTAFPPRARRLLREQLQRLADGRPLINVVAGPVG